MRILLIGINFGNYEKKIVDYLREQGHYVYYIYDTDAHYNFYSRIFGKSISKKISIYYQRRMLKKMPSDFDRVIVIVGRELTIKFLQNIKEKSKTAKFTLYLWDDVKRVENFEETKKIYDEIYSFDLKDCRDYGFKHLPLFFTQRPDASIRKEYDIYSAMFSHSERERIILNIAHQALEKNKSYLFYISLGKFSYFKRRKEIMKNLQYGIEYISSPISEDDNYKNMNKSNAILDIQFSSQIGLTMRTIESLGMKNKIITTNPSVKYYDFYRESNIQIIDRNAPVLSETFLEKPFQDIPVEIYRKYSLDTWIKTLIGEIRLNNYIGSYQINNLSFPDR